MLKILKKFSKNKHFTTIAKLIDMKEYNLDTFWNDYISMLHAKYPNPTYISGYKARYDHGFTIPVVQSLIKDGLLRSKVEGKIVTFALEDILQMKKIRGYLQKAENAELIKEHLVLGKKKFLVFDFYKKDRSIDKYRSELMAIMLEDFYGEIYDFIPKNLSDEDKIELIKNKEKKK
jgi:hypothetical protein